MKKRIVYIMIAICLVANASGQIIYPPDTPPELDGGGGDLEVSLWTHFNIFIGNGFNADYSPLTSYLTETPVQSSVNEQGAALVSIPLELPDVGNSMIPELALHYNSLQPQSMFGNDWGLSGLSEIRRVRKSVYYNGNTYSETDDETIDGTEAFTLNGNRMIITSADFPNSVNYQTETGNIKLKAYITQRQEGNKQQNVYSHFEVFYPNGKTAVFGFEDPEQNKSRNRFPISRIRDRLDNEILYNYEYILDEYRITNIRFGSNKEGSIDFYYGNINVQYGARISAIYHDFVPEKYREQELSIPSGVVLKTVTIGLNAKLFRNYLLSYRSNGQFVFLSAIKMEKDKQEIVLDMEIPHYSSTHTDSVKYSAHQGIWETMPDLPINTDETKDGCMPVRFMYGDGESQSEAFTRTNASIAYNNSDYPPIVVRGVFGKNEKNGVVVFPDKPAYGQEVYSGTETILVKPDLDKPETYTLQTGAGFVGIICVDLDNKTGDEIIRINDYMSGRNNIVAFTVYAINDNGGVEQKYTRSFTASSWLFSNRTQLGEKEFFPGDFNGDGRNELLYVDGLRSGMYNLEGNQTIYNGFLLDMSAPVISDPPDDRPVAMSFSPSDFDYDGGHDPGQIDTNYKRRLIVGDFNGNAKTDLLLIATDGKCSLLEYNCKPANPFFVPYEDEFSLYNNISYLAGDFNGDGRTDLYRRGSNIIYFSTGKKLTEKTMSAIAEHSSYCLAEDMNGDGQTDLVFAHPQKTSIYFFAEGKVAGITETNESGRRVPAGYYPLRKSFYDTQADGVLFYGNNEVVQISYGMDRSMATQLTGVKSGFGVTTRFEYSRLSDGAAYQNTAGVQFPFKNVSRTHHPHVVSKTRTHHKSTLVEVKTYKYENGVAHRQGLGFCGYEKITIHDSIRNQSLVQTFDPLRFGVPTTVETPAVKVANTYSVNVLPDKTAEIRLVQSTRTDKLKNTGINSLYTYDGYGNVLDKTVDFGDDISQITTNTYNNYNNQTLYLLGELQNTSTKSYRKTSSALSKSEFSYDTKGLLRTKKEYYNNNKVSEETSNYSSTGNLLSLGVKTYNAGNSLTKTFEYDSAGRITKETDATGLSIDYSYNDKGQLYRSKDIYGKYTQYEYDNMGRLAKNISPLGAVTTTEYRWIDDDLRPNAPANALYRVKTKTLDATGTMLAPETAVYYDALGRELRSEQLRFDGTWLKTDITYDAYGRQHKTSLPFKGNTPQRWNTYSYDSYDRPTRVAYASGKNDLWTYSGSTVRETVDGVWNEKTYNSAGQLVTVRDANGNIQYTYRPDGQAASIVANGVTTAFTYDEYGRQLTIDDPSAGLQTLTYDDKGNVASLKDAENNISTFVYDDYNRIKTKQMPEYAVQYVYNAYGMLSSISADNGKSLISYGYDNYGRLTSERESYDGKQLQKVYGYTGERLQAQYYYVNGQYTAYEKHNYSNGHHTETRLNNSTVIWKLTAENNMGMSTAAQTGPLTRSYGYNLYGFPTSRGAQSTKGTIFSHAYDFEPQTGNLSYRNDLVNNSVENCTYDNINRLTNIRTSLQNQTLQERNITYATNGNITGIDGIGTFKYNAGKPYQMSEATPETAALPLFAGDQYISYTSFKRPATIEQGGYTAAFAYNARGERVKMQMQNPDGSLSAKYYLGGNYEYSTDGELLYLDGDAYSAPAVYKKENNVWNIYYICRDYQGSIVAIADKDGNKAYEYSYDAWGRLRDPQTMEIFPSHPGEGAGGEVELFLGRGYTGHEHLPQFGLINMNARLYDPVVGRFLSPDPYVQDPTNSQNYNRYSYCLNNPLKYTDPSGEQYYYDRDRGCYVDAFGNRVDNSVVDRYLFNSGYFRGGWNSDFTNYGWNPPFVMGGSGGTTSENAQQKLNQYIELLEVLGVKVTKGNAHANYIWLSFAYQLSPTAEDVSNNILGAAVTEGFKYYYGNNGFLNGTNTALGVGGYIYGGLEKLTVSQGYWLGKNGKYYKTSWGGNQWTGGRSGALKAARGFKWGGVATTIIAGSIDIGLGYYEDEKTYGYNAQKATAGVAGGALGTWGGAALGGYIGMHFAGIGAIPGAIIGGIVGSIGGGFGGSYAGEAIYDGFVK